METRYFVPLYRKMAGKYEKAVFTPRFTSFKPEDLDKEDVVCEEQGAKWNLQL